MPGADQIQTRRPKRISVYGGGSWGTALAIQLARNEIDVLLWDVDTERAVEMQAQSENQKYLPNLPFPKTLSVTPDINEALAFSDLHLIVVPSHAFREILITIKSEFTDQSSVIWATKGLELKTGMFLHEVLLEECPNIQSYGVVSGPTFALEVAKGLPTAMTVAASTEALNTQVAAAFQGDQYRVYTSNDIKGLELGGSVKNVLAVATGMSDGLGFGANARAALITRGLAEMLRLSDAVGVSKETLMGLAGVGDLVLTCTDDQSRNRQFGLALGKGMTVDEAIESIGQVVEGAKTSKAIRLLAERLDVDMPICFAVCEIVEGKLEPREAVARLLNRQLRSEF